MGKRPLILEKSIMIKSGISRQYVFFLSLLIFFIFSTIDGRTRPITSGPILSCGIVFKSETATTYATTFNQITLLTSDQSGKPKTVETIPAAGVQQVAIFGSKLAYVNKENIIHILDLNISSQHPNLSLTPPRRSVVDLCFIENHLNVGLVDGTVLIYDLASPQSPIYTIGSNNSHVDQIRFHLPSQQFLIYRRELLSLWNFVKRKKIWQTDQVVGSIQSIQFDQKGQLVAVLSRNQILVYTNQSPTSSKSNRLAIAVCEGRTDPFLAFCFGPSDTLLTVQKSGQISQWGISKQSSQIIRKLPQKDYTTISYLQNNLERYWVTTNEGEIISHSLDPIPLKKIGKKQSSPMVKKTIQSQPKSSQNFIKATAKDTVKPTVKLSPKPPATITVGRSLQVKFTSSQKAVILAGKIPNNATFSDKNWLNWEPTPNQVGTFDFQFYAITDDNRSQPINFAVQVDANQPPRFLSVGGQTVGAGPLTFETVVGKNLTLTIVAEDPESDPLVFSILPKTVETTIEETRSSVNSKLQKTNLIWRPNLNSDSNKKLKYQLNLTDSFSVIVLPIEIKVNRSLQKTDSENPNSPTQKLPIQNLLDSTKSTGTERKTTSISMPLSMVKITSADHPDFFIDQYEVTNADFIQFLNKTDLPVSDLIDLSASYVKIEKVGDVFRVQEGTKMDQFPVVGVSWLGASAFAHWKQKTLPTAEQWEIAAQQQDGWAFPWGDEPLTSADWEMTGPIEVGAQGLDVSPSLVFDLATNVAEWTTSEEEGKQIIKGGSWKSRQSDSLKASVFLSLLPSQTLSWVGFRCVLVPVSTILE